MDPQGTEEGKAADEESEEDPSTREEGYEKAMAMATACNKVLTPFSKLVRTMKDSKLGGTLYQEAKELMGSVEEAGTRMRNLATERTLSLKQTKSEVARAGNLHKRASRMLKLQGLMTKAASSIRGSDSEQDV
jgi:hypothetical protein